MTLYERELLTRFLQQLAQARGAHKDAEAETLIGEAVAKQPDAAYLLVQRAIQLEQLLDASQRETHRLQSELEQAHSGRPRTFLEEPYAWGSRPANAAVEYSTAPRAAAPAAAPAARSAGWGSGLFGNIASTAAGVVAGSFLFQGLQGLMHRGDAHAADQAGMADLSQLSHLDRPAAEEPELLNSYDTPDLDKGDSYLADADGFDDVV